MNSPDRDIVRPLRFLDDLRGYSRSKLRADILAGLTVAVFAVPQVMAYAMLAGLPPVNGLYAAVVLGIVAALFGDSDFLNSGPTNSSGLLTAGVLVALGAAYAQPVVVFHLMLLVGAIRLVLALFRMGWLMRFVPESALIGFTAGAAILIATGQLHHLLEVSTGRQTMFFGRMLEVIRLAPTANPRALAIGFGTCAAMLLFHRHSRRWPVALFTIITATVAAACAGGVRLVGDIALVPDAIPLLQAERLRPELFLAILPDAIALAAIGLIEAVSIGEILAMKRRQHLNVNQEFFGQGLSHLVGAFFGAFPGSGSFSRSALIEQVGGQTRLANVIFGFCILLAALFLPLWLNKIPIAALAGLLLFIGINLIDVRKIKRVIETSRVDTLVMIATCFVTIFIDIEYGIFAGIAVAMAAFLNRASRPKLFELLPAGERRFDEIPYEPDQAHTPSSVVTISVHGELFFGMAHLLRDQLNEVVRRQQPRHIIIRLRRAYSIDFSCWSAIFEFAEGFRAAGGTLYLCGAVPDVVRIVRDARMQHVLPPEHIYPATARPFEALSQALRTVFAAVHERASLSPAWRTFTPTEDSAWSITKPASAENNE